MPQQSFPGQSPVQKRKREGDCYKNWQSGSLFPDSPCTKTAPMSTMSILKAGEFPNQFYVPAGTVIKHKRRYCIVLRFTSSSSAASLHSFLFPALPYTGQAGSQSKNFSLHIDQTETGSGCTKYSCLENLEKSMRYQKKNSTCHDQLCQMQMCFSTT